MRLDKFLADMGYGSRKEVKGYIKKGRVTVNDQTIKSDKAQVNEQTDRICFDQELIHYQRWYYYLLHKPAGVISATVDSYEDTVLDLFSEEDFREDLFPVGRLDKDTEGFLLITNDGGLAHQLLSPKKHVEKEYYAQVDGIMTAADQTIFEKGVQLDGEWTLPAQLTIIGVDHAEGTSEIRLVLHEGKFHQVKRMVHAVGKEVRYLKRIRMGGLALPADLPVGSYRPLTADELTALVQPKE